MNKNLQNALEEQRIKKNARKIIVKSHTANHLNEENLYKTFVEPFVDVFDSLKIASKDIMSNVMMMTGQVLTLSPETQKKRMQKYEDRQKKIESQWKPLMDKADAALSTGDADIVALAFSPGVYLASAFGATAYNAAEGVGKFLDDLGLKKGMLSILPGVSDVETSSSEPDTSDDKKSLLDMLNTLFIGTALASTSASVLLKTKESENQKKESKNKRGVLLESSKKLANDLSDFMRDTGLADEFQKMQDELFEYYQDVIREVDEIYSSRKEIVAAAANATTMEELSKALNDIKTKEVDMSDAIKDIEKNFEDSKKKLVKDDDFLKTLEDESNDAVLSDDAIEKAAEKTLFASFVTEFKKSTAGELEKIKEELGKELQASLPEQSTLDMLRKTKSGLDVFNMIRDAKSRYNIK